MRRAKRKGGTGEAARRDKRTGSNAGVIRLRLMAGLGTGVAVAVVCIAVWLRTSARGVGESNTAGAQAGPSAAQAAMPAPQFKVGPESLRYEAVLRRLQSDALVSSNADAPAEAPAGQSQPDAKTAAATLDPVTQYKIDSLKLATADARRDDFKSAMAVLAAVKEKLGAADPFVDELSGTLLVMKKDYAGGEASFRNLIQKVPDSLAGRFNLAEAIFLQHRYEEAESNFAYLDALQRDSDPALADLCRFKRVMCLLAAGKPDLAAKLIPDQTDPSADSPAMRYCAAAICYRRKDYSAADSIIRQVRAELGENVENLFADSFIELKWGSRDANGNFHVSEPGAKG